MHRPCIAVISIPVRETHSVTHSSNLEKDRPKCKKSPYPPLFNTAQSIQVINPGRRLGSPSPSRIGDDSLSPAPLFPIATVSRQPRYRLLKSDPMIYPFPGRSCRIRMHSTASLQLNGNSKVHTLTQSRGTPSLSMFVWPWVGGLGTSKVAKPTRLSYSG